MHKTIDILKKILQKYKYYYPNIFCVKKNDT